MTAVHRTGLLERLERALRLGAGRACRASVRVSLPVARDDLARLGLLALGERAGTDELSRLALLPIGGGGRYEVGLFARNASTGSDSL
jgi:hypothetical protein